MRYTDFREAIRDGSFDWQFNTFNDQRLVKILEAVKLWCLSSNKVKSTLTISGPTERGKTHLLKRVEFLFKNYACNFPKKKLNYPEVEFVSWGIFTKGTLDEGNYFDKVSNSGLVLIDDFLSEFYKDKSLNKYKEIVLAKAFDLLNVRVGKPTLITTNLSLDEIGLLDDRISSRLLREGGQFIKIPDTMPKFLGRKE